MAEERKSRQAGGRRGLRLAAALGCRLRRDDVCRKTDITSRGKIHLIEKTTIRLQLDLGEQTVKLFPCIPIRTCKSYSLSDQRRRSKVHPSSVVKFVNQPLSFAFPHLMSSPSTPFALVMVSCWSRCGSGRGRPELLVVGFRLGDEDVLRRLWKFRDEPTCSRGPRSGFKSDTWADESGSPAGGGVRAWCA